MGESTAYYWLRTASGRPANSVSKKALVPVVHCIRRLPMNLAS